MNKYFKKPDKKRRHVKLYVSRDDKPKWTVTVFKDVFNRSAKVLDVGCDERQLKGLMASGVEYTGIDMQGSPDICLDLDLVKKLPFESESFDLVFCTEVLEHLENFHLIFDELCRVSRSYVLISLPNALAGISAYLMEREYSGAKRAQEGYGRFMKFYGLPVEIPKDRHRWFFNVEEAIEFVRSRSGKNGYEIEEVLHTIDFEKWHSKIGRFLLSGMNRKRMINIFNNTTWFLIKKKD